MKNGPAHEKFYKLNSKEKDVVLNFLLDGIKLRDAQIEELKMQLSIAQSKPFARSSEKIQEDDKQALLFNEAELAVGLIEEAEQPEEPEETTEVKAHKRAVRKHATSVPPNTPSVHIYDYSPDTCYNAEGLLMKRIEDALNYQLVLIPARYIVEIHHKARYKVVDALSEDAANDTVVTYESPVEKIGASPSLIAHLVISKFDDHLPLYRQEEIFKRQQIDLSRQKMAKWLIDYYDALQPLEKYFKKRLYQSNFISKDETGIQVLDVKSESGKPATNGFMYITIGSTFNAETRKNEDLVWVDYIQGKARPILFEDIEKYGYKGYLMTDGLKGYLSYELHCVCWVHAIRRMKEVQNYYKKYNKTNQTATTIINEYNKLFFIEDKLREQLIKGEITTDQFLSIRKRECEKIIDYIYELIDLMESQYACDGVMGTAIKYFQTYRKYMKNYLEVVEASPSNNACERVAKAFATGRKNWLFAKSVDGADASGFYFSLIESAKCCHINPYDYIEAICTFGPYAKTDEDWESLLPWNIDLSRLDSIRKARENAQPDPNRTEPYFFTGVHR